ncbi:hypothetical protein COO91_10988 (plasmid) [Nostoc flagelliforme CCNUN1]|uniref:Uncharacterized protein n=1 Tax=Nostoc flagelliforme CCNUN1 TaxID=2038116 RepID=A0A2K8TCH9_9NOSO|nr:hypothetical protein COO91_10988 [Nostoc flagelliforme CCNUN1]
MATPNLFESVVLNHNVVCTHNKSDRRSCPDRAIAFYPFIKELYYALYNTYTASNS